MTCPDCSGYGYIGDGIRVRLCQECEGSGEIPDVSRSEIDELRRHVAELDRIRSEDLKSKEPPMEDRMLKWFAWEHLPPHLAEVSSLFAELALAVCNKTEPGPERTVALRKLLEAKDAAVRAKLHPGG